jgi:hypothetical protein
MTEILVFLALIGVLATWLLLPMVPAIELYKRAPASSISATGVLANFKINATGAVAVYVVLFAATAQFVYSTHNYVGNILHPYWTISGTIRIVDNNNTIMHYANLFHSIQVRTTPETYSFNDPPFQISIPERGIGGGLPPVVLELPGYEPAVLLDAKSKIKSSSFYKTIEIEEPIVIKKASVNDSSDARPQ